MSELIQRKTVVELVRSWDAAIRDMTEGLRLIKRADEHLQDFSNMPNGSYNLRTFTHECTGLDVKRKMDRLKREAWRTLIQRVELRKFLTQARNAELDRQLDGGHNTEPLPDITVDNVFAWLDSMSSMSADIIHDLIRDAYRRLCPKNGDFKTNKGYRVGEKVILTNVVEKNYPWDKASAYVVLYHAQSDLRVIDNVFHLLDGKPMSAYTNGDLEAAVRESRKEGETEYFRFKCYSNGNMHLWMKRLDLVARLNEVGADGNTLPK